MEQISYSSRFARPRWLLSAGFSLLLLLSACEEKLPEPTAKGANTFACRVNGEAWIPDAGGSFSGKKLSVLYEVDQPEKSLSIYATRITKKDNTHILLALEDVRTTGTQYFAFDTNPYDTHFLNVALYNEYKPNQADYMTNTHFTGSITITHIDTVKHIIAGTFAFTAENTDGSGETVKVTDGRFDVKYGL